MNNHDTHILTTEQGTLLIGQIAPLEQLEAAANDEEIASVATFTASSRRAERLAWRIMLRQHIGSKIEVAYSKEGAPHIKNLPHTHISVSHCQDKVVVALSTRRCAVDIELLNRNFAALSTRYMNTQELALAPNSEALAAIWCGKETLYKLCGESGLDIRSDITISALNMEQGVIKGNIKGQDEVKMHIVKPDEQHIIVYYI